MSVALLCVLSATAHGQIPERAVALFAATTVIGGLTLRTIVRATIRFGFESDDGVPAVDPIFGYNDSEGIVTGSVGIVRELVVPDLGLAQPSVRSTR